MAVQSKLECARPRCGDRVDAIHLLNDSLRTMAAAVRRPRQLINRLDSRPCRIGRLVAPERGAARCFLVVFWAEGTPPDLPMPLLRGMCRVLPRARSAGTRSAEQATNALHDPQRLLGELHSPYLRKPARYRRSSSAAST